jgi:hypothetical protein
MLEEVVDLHGKVQMGRIPIRDAEVVQTDPFPYETAQVETEMDGNSMRTGMEYGLWHM